MKFIRGNFGAPLFVLSPPHPPINDFSNFVEGVEGVGGTERSWEKEIRAEWAEFLGMESLRKKDTNRLDRVSRNFVTGNAQKCLLIWFVGFFGTVFVKKKRDSRICVLTKGLLKSRFN